MLDPRYSEALAFLQEEARVSAALVAAGEASPEGLALAAKLSEVQSRMGGCVRECGRILQVVVDSDDPSLTLDALSPERLMRLMGR